jgi:hypothetical protein
VELLMTELMLALLAIVPSTIVALAFYRRAKAAEVRAEAERIWAGRVDPKNQHFRQPLIGRKQ